MHIETIGNATLYLGDCRDILASIPRVDATVTDPPYGINFDVGTRSRPKHDIYAGGSYHRPRGQRVIGDDIEFDPSILPTGPQILWGANNYANKLTNSNGWLCWHKDGGIKNFSMSQCELAWTNFLKSTRHISHMWHGFKRDSEVGERVMHDTQKPIAIMKWCINLLPPNHSIILDPYMGSGTTGVACHQLGKDFIGIEIDPGYFDVACRRIEQAQRQPDMFLNQFAD